MSWAQTIYNPEHRVAYIFWANLLASGSTLVLLSPLYYKLAWRFAKDVLQRMLGYALPLVLAAVAGIVNQLIGTPLLKILGPGTTEENLALGGIYAAAAKLAVLMNLFVQAFNYAAEPFFFRQAAENNDKAIYADVTRAFALIGSLGFLGIMLYLEVIQNFLGQSFRQGLGVLPILLVANFFLGLYYNFAIGYKLSDQTRWASYIAAMGAIITLAVNLTFIPSLTIYAPAWASLACFASMCIAAYFVTQKFWPVNYQIGRMVYYLLTAIAAWLISIRLAQELPDQLAFRIGANTILLTLTLLVWYRTEKEWVKRILGKSSSE